MAMSATAVSALLKEMYPDDVLQNLVYESNPLLAMIPKEEEAAGEYVKVPLIYGNPQNRSATFSNANAGSSGTALQAFLLTYAENYSIASVTGKVARASRNNEGAFAKALELEMDGALKSLANDVASSLYRTADGWKAQVNAEPAEAGTTVITLKNVEDITGFEVGMVVNIWSAVSGGSQRSTDGSDVSWTITNVDRDDGSLKVTVVRSFQASWIGFLHPRLVQHYSMVLTVLSTLLVWVEFAFLVPLFQSKMLF